MTRTLKAALPVVLAGCLSIAAILWYVNHANREGTPQSICGTKVSRNLSEPLLGAGGKITEQNRVDRKKPEPSSWCEVRVDGRVALSMRFAWHPDAVDPLKVAESSDSVSNIGEPARLVSRYEIALGNNGAISTVQCRTDVGSYFTLTLLLEKANPTSRNHRESIEKFIRTYFPVTVKGVSCA
ncbi:hypothetical protein [Streptomyces sp. NPDC088358]|uniref:hypothetical protein n=1 Tax=Streptomyces sp. NPDC088358 TaxID=3365857 RepID=UPI00380C12C9